ncbi:MAG: hypothetical protein PHZ02_01515 [Desulfocapsaceae bacterium]|nr:hypothetical protein [Desulfocapsaceae bacterium]
MDIVESHLLKPGEYGKRKDGVWIVRSPNGLCGDLCNHEVVEHDDRTITVSPSILISDGNQTYHGYLEKGVWREV